MPYPKNEILLRWTKKSFQGEQRSQSFNIFVFIVHTLYHMSIFGSRDHIFWYALIVIIRQTYYLISVKLKLNLDTIGHTKPSPFLQSFSFSRKLLKLKIPTPVKAFVLPITPKQIISVAFTCCCKQCNFYLPKAQQHLHNNAMYNDKSLLVWSLWPLSYFEWSNPPI